MRTCDTPYPCAVLRRQRWADDGSLLDQTLTIAIRQLVARHPDLRADDLDDLRQDALVVILPKLERYDPARSSWRTYVSRVTKHALANTVRSFWRRGSHRRECSLACPEARQQGDGICDLFGLRMPHAEQMSYTDAADHYCLGQVIETALRMVTPLQRAICDGILQGERITALALRLHLPRTQIYRELHLVGQALLAAGLEAPQ
jgi:DNA-directed RNA polymerase specialized sigma24 family protein